MIDGNKAVLEFSFQMNTTTPEEGKSFAMDLQYNDQDSVPGGSNTRTIVWSWSASDPKGPNQIQIGRMGWGYVNYVAEPECKHTNTKVEGAKEATETEEGYTGDMVCKDCGETVKAGEKIPVKTPDPVDPPVSEEKPPKTGDTAVMMIALALIAVAGAGIVTRRRKISESSANRKQSKRTRLLCFDFSRIAS